VLIKLAVAASLCLVATAKDYENFDLPKKTGSVPVPTESRVSYKSERVSLQGSNMRLKESSFNSQEFLFAKEAFLAEKRDESIKLLRQQMDSGFKANRDNMLLRLGQLYAEKYMELSYGENEMFTRQLETYEKKKAADKNLKRPTMDNSRSRRYLKDALALFYSIEKEYPKHAKVDEVIFFIGFVEMESGNVEKGVRYLERVVRQYPRSRKFDEAVVYLGDHYFDKVKFRDAIAKFNILLRRQDSPLYHYANYKLAWCELNTAQQVKGMRRMKGLVAALQGTTDKAKFNLREQALKDLVVFYGETEAVDEAIEFFTDNQGKEKALENLRLIADILRSKARDEAAIRAYTKLVNEFPMSIEAPMMLLGMYESRVRLGQNAKAVDSLVDTIQRYGATSDWAKSFPPEKAGEVKEVLESIVAEGEKAALFHHNSAQKSSNKTAYASALKLYTALLESFPNFPERKKFHFYRAEILFNQSQWLAAANSYMESSKVAPKDKLTDEAVYNALLALDHLTAKSEKIERFTKEQQKTVDLTPKEIPSEEQRFIEVATFYIKEYPGGNRIVDVKFRIAAIHYRFHHFDLAQTEFRNIALAHPKHRSATTAAHIVLDIYNIKKDYAKLDDTANVFAATKDLGDAAFKAEMAQLSGEIGFKKLEGLEQDNKWTEAGDKYFQFYTANPTGPLAEKSLYNAYVSFEKGEDVVRSAETSKLFIAKFPKSQYAQQMTLALAKNAERQYDFEIAQDLYENYHKKFPQDKEARKALYNAAVFAELLERNQEALALYGQYLKGNVTPEEKRAIWVSQAKIHRRLGNWNEVSNVYRRLARESKSLDERLSYLGELARQYDRGGKLAERTAVINEMRVMYSQGGKKASGMGAQFVAEAMFKSLSKQREAYEKVALRFPPEDLVYLLKRKEKMLSKLAAAYDEVVEIGVPEWGVAALLEKSTAYENLVTAFRAVQIPANMKGETRDEATTALKAIDGKMVAPLETRSQEILKACVARASEFHVANEFSAKCQQKLKQPGETAEPTGVLPQPSYWSTRYLGEEVARRD